MKGRREWRAAFAAMAAAAGICFSSGRETVLFFSQTGRASWLGVIFASAGFGLLCGTACRFARVTGAVSLPDVYRRVLGGRLGELAGALYGLLMAAAAGVMLARAGALAALTLPVRHAFGIGMALAMGLALMLNMRRMRGLPWAGGLAVGCAALFHLALALDPREPVLRIDARARSELSGSVTASLALAALHASLAAAAAGGAVVRFAGWAERPWMFAGKCAILMGLLLAAVNGAVLTGGERLIAQALPVVPLAARWGLAGYYACVLVMAACAVTTLAASMGALIGRSGNVGGKRYAAAMTAICVMAALVTGGGKTAGTGFLMLSPACALSMAALGWRSAKTGWNHDKITC